MLTRQDFTQPYLIFDENAEKRLQECIAFVNEKRPDLEDNLKKEFTKEHWKNKRCYIYTDFAPLSFYFDIRFYNGTGWLRDYNGGIIFHGKHDGGGNGSAPTYSVNITPVDGWATHT
jgi:hypothetical protein